MKNSFIIPKRIQLEVVFGCNLSCIMCPVNAITKRKKGIMSNDLFEYIVDEMKPYREGISKFDLWGLGEPLIDPALFEKINYAKTKGFRNTAISTNATLLDAEKQYSLLESGIDTVIFSIDGVNKETHEKIRQGANFDKVLEHAEGIIRKRDYGKYKTRFVFRFIRQNLNTSQFPAFQKLWEGKLSKRKGDIVIGYDVHSWGGEMPLKEKDKLIIENSPAIDEKPCHHIFDRLIFLWDGTVPLCCSDLHHAYYNLGTVKETPPMEIFNNDIIGKIRKIHESGRKKSIRICKQCTILYSETTTDVFD